MEEHWTKKAALSFKGAQHIEDITVRGQMPGELVQHGTKVRVYGNYITIHHLPNRPIAEANAHLEWSDGQKATVYHNGEIHLDVDGISGNRAGHINDKNQIVMAKGNSVMAGYGRINEFGVVVNGVLSHAKHVQLFNALNVLKAHAPKSK